MRRFSLVDLALAAIVIATAFGSSSAGAASQTFVSGTADAANTACTHAAPCLNFALAYTATSAGGEIACLDSGGYLNNSTLNISHSITINCDGTNGSVNNGVFVISTAATDVVVLKGLDIDIDGVVSNAPPASGLINFGGAGVLHVENTRISNIKGNQFSGILFNPTGPAKLIVKDSSITNIGNAGTSTGIYIKPASGVTANVAIERSDIDVNNFGIIADGTGGGIIRGTISDSFVTNNINNGITVSTTSSSVVLNVDNTKVSGNAYGLVAAGGSNAGMLVRRSIINSNATGLYTTGGGVLYSYRDNSVNGNTTTDGAFTGTVNLQ
jgi:hypothetical protein